MKPETIETLMQIYDLALGLTMLPDEADANAGNFIHEAVAGVFGGWDDLALALQQRHKAMRRKRKPKQVTTPSDPAELQADISRRLRELRSQYR